MIVSDKECSMYALSMSEARALTEGRGGEGEDGGESTGSELVRGLAEAGLALRPGAIPLGAREVIHRAPETDVQPPDLLAQLSHKQKKKLLK